MTSTLDWVKENRKRFLTYLRGFRRLKKSTCGPWIRSTEKPSLRWQIPFAFLRPKLSVVDTLILSQWCSQDSFQASSTRFRIFVKTYIFPVICKSLKSCISKKYMYSQLRNQSCFFLLFDIFTLFSKKDASIRSVLKLFPPIFKKTQTRCKYDSVPYRASVVWRRTSSYSENLRFRPSTRKRQSRVFKNPSPENLRASQNGRRFSFWNVCRSQARKPYSKTCDFGAQKRRLHGDWRLKRRKKNCFKKKRVIGHNSP